MHTPRILENLQIAHPSADCADPTNAPNRRAGRLLTVICISSSDRTFKITTGIFTGHGVFAKRNFDKGDFLLHYQGEL
ncbi:hypothetical protein LSAT2_012134 [Lamellibrachia satsuma]|nr:hypothetical protein LSAT2_012134 [Lamellibrachia satsuma]